MACWNQKVGPSEWAVLLLKDMSKNIIDLEIAYENSPFVQYVGYYDIDSSQFTFNGQGANN